MFFLWQGLRFGLSLGFAAKGMTILPYVLPCISQGHLNGKRRQRFTGAEGWLFQKILNCEFYAEQLFRVFVEELFLVFLGEVEALKIQNSLL